MSLEHVTAVLDHSTQRGPRLVTLLAVAFNCDQRGEWTTDQATLRREARVGRTRIKQILKDLVASGELSVVSHHGRGRLSKYRLLIGPGTAKPLGLRASDRDEPEVESPAYNSLRHSAKYLVCNEQVMKTPHSPRFGALALLGGPCSPTIGGFQMPNPSPQKRPAGAGPEAI